MKYETPELTALTLAISAVQGVGTPKNMPTGPDAASLINNEHVAAYADWE